jgi:hypothetical protein
MRMNGEPSWVRVPYEGTPMIHVGIQAAGQNGARYCSIRGRELRSAIAPEESRKKHRLYFSWMNVQLVKPKLVVCNEF